ncbi:hypothetical protein B4U79_08376 [Dinothrombium tinctorium]|uniref:Uncharacterized protein n=1 Tax=Dinothrombium tinctorium TaxID=1965070 RepID=A0A443Q7J1_9ACAR|nr:hypothetical protein B4U79_08376 [Dinothrombium tinctorium]
MCRHRGGMFLCRWFYFRDSSRCGNCSNTCFSSL